MCHNRDLPCGLFFKLNKLKIKKKTYQVDMWHNHDVTHDSLTFLNNKIK